MLSKYHDIIFKVVKVYNNSLDFIDPQGIQYHPKKYFVKKLIMLLLLK